MSEVSLIISLKKRLNKKNLQSKDPQFYFY